MNIGWFLGGVLMGAGATLAILGICRLQRRLLFWLLFLIGCTTKPNLRYCDDAISCPAGMSCDLVKRECAPELPPDLAATEDMAAADDLAATEDLAELSDMVEVPDLLELPDMLPPPDLEPPPVFFDPEVQAILNSGGGGGCAKSGCHDASDGLYTPFLIPNPSTQPAVHANYLSFGAVAETTAIAKLVKSNGTSHGGAMTSGDRKPCVDMATEPCASLVRWYQAGKPEVRP